jgi:hypothetical protein
LHQVGRVHGEVSPASIVLRPSGATLLPPNGLLKEADFGADVAAFGAVLYEMLTGGKPPSRMPPAAPTERVPHTGPAGLRAAATRLAAKCLTAPPDQAPPIQMVVTEVRLLDVLARQSGAESPAPTQHAPQSPPSAQREAAPETRRKAGPLAEWLATAAPVEKPAHAAPAESFVRGVPTREFVSAMLSKKPVPSLARSEPDAELLEEEHDGAPDNEEEIDDRPPTPLERCPKCGSSQVRESRPRTKMEFFLSGLGIPIRRCHRCYHRYMVVYRYAFTKAPPPA